MNEGELKRQEAFDAEVYGSTRACFEHILFRMMEKAAEGDKKSALEYRAILLESYNSVSNDVQKLVGRVRRLEQELRELKNGL